MTEAYADYLKLRMQRESLRRYKNGLSHQEEADLGAKMHVYWEQMTKEEQESFDRLAAIEAAAVKTY